MKIFIKKTLFFAGLLHLTHCAFSQKTDSTKHISYFFGAVSVTNNGISIVPSFSLEKPAVQFNLTMGKNRFSVEPDIRFSLAGKPWSFLFWSRYKVVTGNRFNMNVGTHLGLNFKTSLLPINGDSSTTTVTRRYLAGELFPRVSLTKNISVGIYYLYSHGLDAGTIGNTHFITFNTNFSNIKIADQFFMKFNPQLYYLKLDTQNGFYFTSTLTVARKNFPLSVSSTINKIINTNITGSKNFRCEGGVANGEITAFKMRMAGQNNDHWRSGDKTKANRSTSEGFLKPYFDTIKNISFAEVIFVTPIPTMWWRSVYASTNGFAFESFMDELAIAAGKDPLELRRHYLEEERLHHLIDRLQEISGWKNRKKNQGYGAAITECFGGTVGQVVKVSKQADGKIKIDHVWAVIDCGWYVNPDTIKAQVEGAIVMALGAATIHEITFKDGMVEQKNFYSYTMPGIMHVPPIEVHIMENDFDAGGVGEPGLPAFAPALTNAIFDLTGKRIRKLPFSLAKV